MSNFRGNAEQARIAFEVYVRGSREWVWDPIERIWVPASGDAPTASGDDPRAGGLSQRALDRIAGIQDAERRGLVSHDAAEQEILQIIREET